MNLLFFKNKKGELVAVNPANVTYLENGESTDGKPATGINVIDDYIVVSATIAEVSNALKIAMRGN